MFEEQANENATIRIRIKEFISECKGMRKTFVNSFVKQIFMKSIFFLCVASLFTGNLIVAQQQTIIFKNGTFSDQISIPVEPAPAGNSINKTASPSKKTAETNAETQVSETAYEIFYYDSLYFEENQLNSSIRLLEKNEDGTFTQQAEITDYFFSPAVSGLGKGQYYLLFITEEEEYYLRLAISYLD